MENENNPEISFFTAAIDQDYTKIVLAESYITVIAKNEGVCGKFTMSDATTLKLSGLRFIRRGTVINSH